MSYATKFWFWAILMLVLILGYAKISESQPVSLEAITYKYGGDVDKVLTCLNNRTAFTDSNCRKVIGDLYQILSHRPADYNNVTQYGVWRYANGKSTGHMFVGYRDRHFRQFLITFKHEKGITRLGKLECENLEEGFTAFVPDWVHAYVYGKDMKKDDVIIRN